eukprot:jgi/Ulvmu1/24/UM001_0025.1
MVDLHARQAVPLLILLIPAPRSKGLQYAICVYQWLITATSTFYEGLPEPLQHIMHRILALAAALPPLAHIAHGQGLTFSADTSVVIEDAASGESGATAGAENVAAQEVSGDDSPGRVQELARQNLIPVGAFIRTCDCERVRSVKVDDIRDISDKFVADGNDKSSSGLSNMVWGFGQFLDHDLALSIEREDDPTIAVGTETDVMNLHKVVTTNRRGCKNSLNVHTHRVDAGPIYGTEEAYVQEMLREPNTCFLRTAEGGFLPVTTNADSEGRFFMISGDVRVSEHAFLAAQHTVWAREHNRLCREVGKKSRYNGMSEDDKFELVQNVLVAKFQQVVLTEFLPALGITQKDLEDAESKTRLKGVSVEFSIAYRLGHDIIPNAVGDISIADAFNSEDVFLNKVGPRDRPTVTYRDDAEQKLSNVMRQLSTTSANEIDGRLSDALRNFLFGRDMGEDLAGRNIFRGRELGLPTYSGLAECFGITPDDKVERETPDPWLGLLREPKKSGSPLPPTLRAIIIEQFHRSFFGRGGFYWKTFERKVGDFLSEVESSTYGEIISANTDANVSGNVFKA